MARRLNILGFSMARMRGLIGSRDLEAARSIRAQIGGLPAWEVDQIAAIVERAIMEGIPFPDVIEESHAHASAANLLASVGQDPLLTDASAFDADAVDAFWRACRKEAGPEARAFVRGLVEGLPLFGRSIDPEEGSPYAMIGLAKLRAFRPGLVDLRDRLGYQAEQKPGSARLREVAEFAAEFVGWIDQVIDAELDLWYCTD